VLLFNALLPTLVFASLLAAVTVANFSSFTKLAGWWTRLDVLSKATTTLAYAAVMWFLAAAVASQWRGIVRLFEGYPATKLLSERAPGRAWHTINRHRLWIGVDEKGIEPDPNAAYYRYPLLEDEETDEDDVLPTTLGNILLAGERYPAYRYGISIAVHSSSSGRRLSTFVTSAPLSPRSRSSSSRTRRSAGPTHSDVIVADISGTSRTCSPRNVTSRAG
jgi:hypothetical protein